MRSIGPEQVMAENRHMDQSSELQTDVNSDAGRLPESRRKKWLGYLSLNTMPRTLSSLLGWIFNTVYKIWRRFKLEVSQLSFSQWCYFIAVILYFNIIDGELSESPNTVWVGLIAGLGLMRELWDLFHRVWQKTLGKGVLLVLYAATANFALAVSALKINDIAGVEPTPFIFTLGFTTLTMLPFWLIMASVMFFGIALVVQTAWLVVGLLLRIVRVRIRMHWEDERFAILTIIFRLALTPVVITALTQFAGPYMEQVSFTESPIFFQADSDIENQAIDSADNRPVIQLFGESIDAVESAVEQAKREQLARENGQSIELDGESADALMGEVEKQRDLDRLISALPYFERLSAIHVPLNFSLAEPQRVSEVVNSSPVAEFDEQQPLMSTIDNALNDESGSSGANSADKPGSEAHESIIQPEKNRDLDRLIAAFIFYFETYPNSMCKKKPGQHSLVIDENAVLLVEKSDNDLGYTFTVEECVHVYE